MLSPHRALLVMIAAIFVAWACTVSRRSDQLRCGSTADCHGTDTCVQGYCLGDSGCPQGCDTCDPGASPPTCTVKDTGGSSFTCSSGYHCDIHCSSDGACGTITCQSGASCDIICDASNACGNITCNGGPCTIHCIAPSGCRQVSCSSSCACDVACAVGDCGTLSCPRQSGNVYCTASGANNQPCESSPPGCNKC